MRRPARVVGVGTAVGVLTLLSGSTMHVSLCLDACEAAPLPRTASLAPVGSRGPSLTLTVRAVPLLSPGARVPLDVVARNSRSRAVLATHLRVRLVRVVAPRADSAHPCTLQDFDVRQASRGVTLRVAPHHRSGLAAAVPQRRWPQLRMLDRHVDQDGCKAATVQLRLTSTTTRVPR